MIKRRAPPRSRVTLQTIRWITTALVIRRSYIYVVVPVTADARGFSRGKWCVRVTGCATKIRMTRSQRKLLAVREIRRLPIRDRWTVAGFTRNRKPSQGVAGISRCRKIIAVARHTSSFETRKLSVRMARLAIYERVTTGQRKARGRMLRLHRHALVPTIGRVTLLTAIAKFAGVNVGVTTDTC